MLENAPGESFRLESNPSESKLFRTVPEFISEPFRIISKNVLYLL